MATFTIFRTSNSQQWAFHLQAVNNRIVLWGETYHNLQDVHGGIASVKANAPYDQRYTRLTSNRGLPYFTLKGANGQVIGRSEEYSSAQQCEDAIAWVKSNAPTANVVQRQLAI